MAEKVISPKEFEQGLQEFVGKELTDFYYTTDSLVTLLAGKKTPNNRGSEDSEFELMIWGAWEYVIDGKTIETSFMQSKNENIPNLRGRLDDFIESLHPHHVTFISISTDGKVAEVGLDIGGKFVVHGHDDVFLNYSHLQHSPNGDITSATHLRPDEDSGKLTLYQSP